MCLHASTHPRHSRPHPTLTFLQLKGVFAAHGRVRNCSLAGCFAFVEFERSKHAGAPGTRGAVVVSAGWAWKEWGVRR